MIVYIVICLWSNEDGCRDSDTHIFYTYNKAKAYLDQCVEETKHADYFDDSYKIFEDKYGSYWLAEQNYTSYIEFSIEEREVE
jgi:hypothetical protein